MKTYLLKAAKDDPQTLLQDLTVLEMRANAMGLFPAARALNNARMRLVGRSRAISNRRIRLRRTDYKPRACAP